jgi:hypothetical protein
MELLAVYEEKDLAEDAEAKVSGPKRLASDRDDNQMVWRLFGTPSWANFYALEMYELPKLKQLVDQRKAGAGQGYDREEHQRIVGNLASLVNTYGLKVPEHWL